MTKQPQAQRRPEAGISELLSSFHELIFGIKRSSIHPQIQRVDIFLRPVSGSYYDVRGTWAFEKERTIQDPFQAPWTDAEYESLFSFNPLVPEFREPFN